MKTHLHASPESGKAFYMKYHGKGEVTMLNLLRFREQADYSGLDDIAPSSPISGEEAYDLYYEHTLPFLEEAGGEVVFYGKSGNYLIGPEVEEWDVILLVKHASAEQFIAFAQNEAYLRIAGHRTAALEDSRLLPILSKE